MPSDKLQAAISALGAVEVAPGFYAVPNPQPRLNRLPPWAVVPVEMLEGWSESEPSPFLRRIAVNMPAWWTPERRFVYRPYGMNADVAVKHKVSPKYGQCFTADLETGEEVPA